MEENKNYNYNAYPRKDEQFYDYRERITKNKKQLNLTWEDIKYLCKFFYNKKVSDNWRKFFYGMKEREEFEKFDKSILIINDIHLPYERSDVLNIIEKHKNEITTLVIAGDLMDCKAISSFPDINRGSIVDELLYAYDFMVKVRKILDNGQKIILHNGNHEERWKTIISKMQEKDIQSFLNPNILEMLVKGFTLYKNDEKIFYDGIKDVIFIPSWYIIIDDIIIAHQKDFSKVKGRILENITSHFLNKNIEFTTIVFGHTHKYSCGTIDRYQNKFVIENPCLCKPQKYSDSGKLGFAAQSYGYTIIKYNNNEKVNPNNIKTYLLDEEVDVVSKNIVRF